ncbi:CDP-alcohol phosphatidyltransferase [Streptomyces sp. NPDC001406]|uniref:CDP-alcohol phosphatidyltransferase n=1 Tax=Streptomyces sp. NPDC001406 TaxID=3364572 RepID=UPI00368F35C1
MASAEGRKAALREDVGSDTSPPATAVPGTPAPAAEADGPAAGGATAGAGESAAVTEPAAEIPAEPKLDAEAATDAEVGTATRASETPASDSPAPATPITAAPATAPEPPAPRSGRRIRRIWRGWRAKYPTVARVLSVVTTVLSAALVYICLQMPSTLGNLKPVEFMRLPAEAVLGAVVLLSLPRKPRLVVSALSGALLGAITVLNMFDMGFNEYLGRHFNIVLDWSLFDDARAYLDDTLGGTAEMGITVGVVLLVFLLMTLVALATVRLGNLLAKHRARTSKATLIVGTVWITCTALGLTVGGIPIASQHTAGVLKVQARTVRDTLRDEAEFANVAKVDKFGNTPADQLVPDLRGKDMIFTFIESYGRSAVEDPIEAPGVDKTLDERTAALAKAGFHAKSGWLTSATYGGSSWLGHSTTLSGLWISNQQRYRTVMASDHLSLTKVFKKTGAYDTVGVMPGVQKGWPEQKYYGLDKVYNAFQLGYEGPKFSWSTMPDQYALEQFQQRVHSQKRADGKQLMSEIILTSSHQPWAPIPKMVGWDQLGDGSVFKGIQAAGNKASDVIADTTKSRQEYGKSIQYSVTALTQWLERYGNDNTVLVFLGDHQPIARVSGNHASRDVPISIVAKDPKVLDKIAGWNWTDGLRPAHNAPVWKMSSFRDRFLTAYGSTPHPKKG